MLFFYLRLQSSSHLWECKVKADSHFWSSSSKPSWRTQPRRDSWKNSTQEKATWNSMAATTGSQLCFFHGGASREEAGIVLWSKRSDEDVQIMYTFYISYVQPHFGKKAGGTTFGFCKSLKSVVLSSHFWTCIEKIVFVRVWWKLMVYLLWVEKGKYTAKLRKHYFFSCFKSSPCLFVMCFIE